MAEPSREKNATPLAMACINGYLDVVSYLIEKCQADINEVCSVIMDGEAVDDATPLWYAAASGHLNLVKLLVRHGASKNSATKNNSTPLRAACFVGHFEIVKYLVQQGADIEIANRYENTCLMVACYRGHYEISKYLLEHGAYISREQYDGKTALHNSIRSGNLDLIKLLLKHGAKVNAKDSHGVTPLMKAAAEGQAKLVEYFTKEWPCTKEEKVDALELLGATVIDKLDAKTMGLDYWRQAMQLRFESRKFPLEKPLTYSALASYVNETEVRSFVEFKKLTSDSHKTEIQALLIRERILGLVHPDTVYYIRRRAAAYADSHNYVCSIKLFLSLLGVQQRLCNPFSEDTHKTLSYISLVCSLMSENLSLVTQDSFSNIMQLFELTLKEIQAAMELSRQQDQDLSETSQFHRTIIIALQIVTLLCSLQPHLDEFQKSKLKQSVFNLVHMNLEFKNGFSPLSFFACFKKAGINLLYPFLPFPSPDVIDLLFEAVNNPNAVSYNGCK